MTKVFKKSAAKPPVQDWDTETAEVITLRPRGAKTRSKVMARSRGLLRKIWSPRGKEDVLHLDDYDFILL